jgi:hypothetical protein
VAALRHLPSRLSGLRSDGARRLTLAAGLILSSCTLLLVASPAGAVVTPVVGGHQYGAEPQSEAPPAAAPFSPLAYENGPVVHNSAPYAIYWDPKSVYGEWEGLVSGFVEGVGNASGSLKNVFAVASQYHDASGSAAFNSNFRGAFTDANPFPGAGGCAVGSPCLSDDQIRAELASFISANGLPTGLNPAGGPTPTYFLFTPPGTTVCLGGAGESGHCSKAGSAGEPLCSYHSFTTVNAATVLYAVVSWNPTTACQDGTGTLQKPNNLTEEAKRPGLGLGDVIVNELADEQIATATDPLLSGWHDAGGARNEIPDKCRNEFGNVFHHGLREGPPGEEFNQTFTFNQEPENLRHYYVNDEFDEAALFAGFPGEPCLNEVRMEPEFTSPNPVRSGDSVTFNATASYVDLGIAKANWSFGDGTTTEVNCEGRTPTNGFAPAQCNGSSGVGNPNSVASVVHHYTFGGAYEVVLTETDDSGNVATVAHVLDVSGPSPPAPPAPAGPGANTQGGASSSSASSASATANSTAAGSGAGAGAGAGGTAKQPVATQAVAPQKLASALRSGLVIRYSVNEQVAGRFEVLLASSLARQLGLHGSSAKGLPKGTAAQTVIAKAVLVTTKGGHNTYKLQFSKTTASRLRRLHKVPLMLRLIVHNASSGTTTVLNKLTLTN